MKTPVGLVNQKIEIHSDQDVPDSSFGVNPNSSLYWATSARVQQLSAPRSLAQMTEQLTPTFRFTVNDRVDKNVQANMLIKYRNQWFTILSAEPDYVYRDILVMTAISGKLPQRNSAFIFNAFYGYLDVKSLLSINQIQQSSYVETQTGKDILIPYSADQPRYFWFWIPDSESVKTGFQDVVNERNEGPIGGSEDFFGPSVIVGAGRFYISNYKTIYYHPPEIPSGYIFKTL